jgi:hypothetical protein
LIFRGKSGISLELKSIGNWTSNPKLGFELNPLRGKGEVFLRAFLEETHKKIQSLSEVGKEWPTL